MRLDMNSDTREIPGKRALLGWNTWKRAHRYGGASSGFENYLGFFSLNRENVTKQLTLGANKNNEQWWKPTNL